MKFLPEYFLHSHTGGSLAPSQVFFERPEGCARIKDPIANA
jgi:hypothetical protein